MRVEPAAGISALKRDHRRLAHALATGEDTRGQLSATQKRALARTRPCQHPGLRLPGSRPVSSKCLWLLNHPACGALLL